MRLTYRNYDETYAFARALHIAAQHEDHYYSYFAIADEVENLGTLCADCGYSVFKCALKAKKCAQCMAVHCQYSPDLCSECCECSNNCTATSCADCGGDTHNECDHCGYGTYCCCGCSTCGYCGDTVENVCGKCYRCEDCCKCVGPSTACWRNATGIAKPDKATVSDVLETVDPVQSMADYYVCDWISYHLPNTQVAADADRHQAKIVRACLPAFLLYGPIAIGGELRYHAHTPTQGSRNGAGRYFLGLVQSAARGEQAFSPADAYRDAAAIFGDGSWTHGYGGVAWKGCAKTFQAYEEGYLSAALMVDRCFSLQHNNGSFLDKMAWKAGNYSLAEMNNIGSIHANAKTDADMAKLAIDRYPTSSYGGCGCSACQGWASGNAPGGSQSSAYASPTAVALWETYRALQVPQARRALEARRAAYYGTAWA